MWPLWRAITKFAASCKMWPKASFFLFFNLRPTGLPNEFSEGCALGALLEATFCEKCCRSRSIDIFNVVATSGWSVCFRQLSAKGLAESNSKRNISNEATEKLRNLACRETNNKLRKITSLGYQRHPKTHLKKRTVTRATPEVPFWQRQVWLHFLSPVHRFWVYLNISPVLSPSKYFHRYCHE